MKFLGCGNGLSHWMVPFPPSAIIVKSFWATESYLPESSKTSDFYSYKPPGNSRQYLVGMHVNSKDFLNKHSIFSSWLWATFFVPPPEGDTKDKGGRPLSDRFDTSCQVGHNNDVPGGVEGVSRNFVLCTNNEGPENHRCGNPWGPKNECQSATCDSCHTFLAELTFPEKIAGLDTHQLQWLFTLRVGGDGACYDEIKAAIDDGDDLSYLSLLNPECK